MITPINACEVCPIQDSDSHLAALLTLPVCGATFGHNHYCINFRMIYIKAIKRQDHCSLSLLGASLYCFRTHREVALQREAGKNNRVKHKADEKEKQKL